MKRTFIIFLTLTTLLSCETNVEEEVTDDTISNSCNPEISFATQVKPIIDTNCVTCHNGIQQFPDLRTFEGIRNNAESVKDQVVSRRMPLGGSLTSEEIETIRCWIDNGALNN